MPNKILRKSIIFILTLSVVVSHFTPILNTIQKAKADPDTSQDVEDRKYGSIPFQNFDQVSNTNSYIPTKDDVDSAKKSAYPSSLVPLEAFVNNPDDTTTTLGRAFDNLFNSNWPKIIFNPADAEDIRKLSCIADMIPNYENDLVALAEAEGNSNLKYYADMKKNDRSRFDTLVARYKSEKEAAIPADLKKPEYLTQLACILGFNSNQEAEKFLNDAKAPDNATIADEEIGQAVDSLKIDTRVLKMLSYLVTPKNKGGAGHTLIKVYRLRKNYTLPNRQYDRESDAIIQQKQQAQAQAASSSQDQTVGQVQESTSQQAATSSGQIVDSTSTGANNSSAAISDFAIGINDSENQTISAHAEGEAVDISSVDSIKCTLIKKRRIGSDSKTAQPPKPIDLQWQTDQGYADSTEGRNDSVNSMVNGLYKNGILDLLDELDISLNNTDDLSAANLGDLLDTVGQALVSQLINQNGNLSGADVAQTLKKVGASYLADRLKIPRMALYGDGYKNLDDFQVNLGRATLEQKLNLPFGSLAGNSATNIFYSTGERKMEMELELPTGTLTPDITNEKQLMVKIGASVVEDKLHLNRGSFLKQTLAQIREAAGSKKFDIIFSMPQAIDTRLNLEGNDSASFKSGATSPSDYLTKIAFKHLSDRAYFFADFINPASSTRQSKRDTAFGTPSGSVDQFLIGNMSSLIDIGRWEIAKKVTRRNDERQALNLWFQANNSFDTCIDPGIIGGLITRDTTPPTIDYIELSEAQIDARFGLQEGDFYSLFGCNKGGADAVFSQIGSQALLTAIKNSPDVAKAEKQLMTDHPEIMDMINTIEFYVNHYNDIDKHLDNLDKEMEDIKNDPDGAEAYKAYQDLKSKIKGRKNTSVNALRTLSKDNKTNLGVLRTKLTKSDTLRPKVNKILYEFDQIFIDLQEMIAGKNNERLTDFKFSDLGIKNDSTTGSSKQATMSIRRAIWLLATGQASVEDILVILGGNKIESELNLPSNTFYYFVQSAKQASQDPAKDANINKDYKKTDGSMEKERFLASLGEAAVEEALNLPPDSFRGKAMPDPRVNESLADIVGHLASGTNMDTSKAKSSLQNGFNSSVSLDLLMTGDTGAWSRARAAYLRTDQTLSLSQGTTQSFISGADLKLDSQSYLTTDELDLLSAQLGIAEPALLKLTKVLAGQDSWQVSPVDFKNFNPYLSDTKPASVGGVCQTEGENVYSYTDQDGDHTFATREQAINYFNAHRDRQFDYIGQIIKGLMAITGGSGLGEAIAKKTLTDFLKDYNQKFAFPDPIVLSTVADRTGVPIATLNRLFTRPISKSNLFKYLVNVGEKVGERRLSSALLSNVGFKIGNQKVGITDLFDVLNGGAPTTLYRIAGNFLDSRLGMNQGTFAQILSAPDATSRECLMKAAGASWLYKQLGIKGLSIYGNPYAALGGSKIESALSWPNNSFKSDSPKGTEDKRAGLIALLNNVGSSNFVKGLRIPIAGLDFLSVARSLFPTAKPEELDSLSNTQILDRLDYLEAQSSLEDTKIYDARKAINKMIIQRLAYIQDPKSVIWSYSNKAQEAAINSDFDQNGINGDEISPDTFTALTLQLPDFHYSGSKSSTVAAAVSSAQLAQEILIFRNHLTQLDSQVGHPTGDTQKLMLGQMTPDDYRNYVSQSQATIIAAMKIGDLLGVEPEKVAAAANMFIVFRDHGSSWQSWSPADKGRFYDAFMTIFELNLDEKAKFRNGTFRKIFTHPEQAKNTLIAEGLHRLDQSIFKGDRRYSLEQIFVAKVDGYNVRECDVAGGQLHSCYRLSLFGDEAAVAAATDQLAAFVYDKTGGSLDLSAPAVKQFLSQFFRTGNVLVLEALANAELAKRINLFENKTVKLPGGFQVVWGDIVGAIYGDRSMETYAADRAEAQALAEFANADFQTKIEQARTAEPNWYDRDGGYGVTGQLNMGDAANPYTGIVSQDNSPRDIATQVTRNINNAYEVPGGTDVSSLRNKYLTPPDPAAYPPIITEAGPVLNTQYDADQDAYLVHKATVLSRRQEAIQHVQQSYQKNLEYHYADSLLFQKDPNIPPGFSAAMFEGNNHTRVNALLAWVKNGVLNGKFLGETINPAWVPALSYLIDRARVGGEAAFADFVRSGEVNKFDDILRQKFNDSLNISLAKGTFTALLAGWQNNGNFKDDYKFTAGGTPITMKSLESVYKENFKERITGWFDNQLGLPTGTTLKAYNGYKAYEAARSSYQVANIAYQAALSKAAASADKVGWAKWRSELTGDPKILQDAQTAAAADKASAETSKKAAQNKQVQMTQVKAELVSFIISKVFDKQLAGLEDALGLVPGSGSMLVSMAVSWYFGLGVTPWTIGLFIALNLFGYYKTEYLCTADGYYPAIQNPPSDAVYDNGHLGVFNGMNTQTKQKEFIKAAQYKARTLLGDVLNMPAKFNDQQMTPSQIMTGRREDVDYWFPKTAQVIYKFTGMPDPTTGELPSRAGLWQNPQTTAYTHIGF